MLLIFDWDGTLSDSTGLITQAMQAAAASLEIPVPEDIQVHNIIGLGLPEALLQLFPAVTDSVREILKDTYRTHFLRLDEQLPSKLFPGVMDTLERLRENGHVLAVATSKSRHGLDRILANMQLQDFFHGSRCADETASKPHPLMLEQLLVEFAHPAADAVMVGDTEYDMDMARQIGMPRIAVSYGAHTPLRLEVYQPDMCLDQFAELLNWPKLQLNT